MGDGTRTLLHLTVLYCDATLLCPIYAVLSCTPGLYPTYTLPYEATMHVHILVHVHGQEYGATGIWLQEYVALQVPHNTDPAGSFYLVRLRQCNSSARTSATSCALRVMDKQVSLLLPIA